MIKFSELTDRIKKEKLRYGVLLIYILLITVSAIVQLIALPTQNYTSYSLGCFDDEFIELSDGQTLVADFVALDKKISSISLNDFELGEYLIFGNEEIHMDVIDANTGSVLDSASCFLISQHVENHQLLFEFHNLENMTLGQPLRLSISTRNMPHNPVSLAVSYANGVEHRNNQLDLDGEVFWGQLDASIVTKETSVNLTILLVYLVELVFGLLVFRYTASIAHKKSSEKKMSFSLTKKKITKSKVAIFAILILFLICFLEYVCHVCEPHNNDFKREKISVIEDNAPMALVIENNTVIEQPVVLPAGPLYGIDIEATARRKGDYPIHYTLVDANGMILGEGKTKITFKDLEKNYRGSSINKAWLKSKDVVLEKPIELTERIYGTLVLEIENPDGISIRFPVTHNANAGLTVNGQSNGFSLCFKAVYDALTPSYHFVCTMAIILFVIFGIFIFLSVFTEMKTETLFLFFALIGATLMCFLIAPYGVPDERSHIDTIYRLMNQIFYRDFSNHPNILHRRLSDCDSWITSTSSVTPLSYAQYSGLMAKASSTSMGSSYIVLGTDVNVPLFCYLPSVIGFLIARVLNLNCLTMIMFGRFCNMICSALLMYVAIRKMPVGRNLMALTALLPMSLQQMASCSYDPMIQAVVFVFIAYSLSFILEKQDKIYDIYILLIFGIFVGQLKSGVYIPTACILFIAYICQFRENKEKKSRFALTRKYFAFLFPIAFSMCVKFMSIVIGIFTRTATTASFDTADGEMHLFTLGYIIQHKRLAIRILEKTFFYRNDFYATTLLGGYLGKIDLSIPLIVLLGFVVILVLGIFVKDREQLPLSGAYRATFVFLVGVCYAMVLFSMFLGWTQLESEMIEGVQGRYFLPVICLFLLAFRGKKAYFEESMNSLLFLGMGYLNVLTFGYALMAVYANYKR